MQNGFLDNNDPWWESTDETDLGPTTSDPDLLLPANTRAHSNNSPPSLNFPIAAATDDVNLVGDEQVIDPRLLTLSEPVDPAWPSDSYEAGLIWPHLNSAEFTTPALNEFDELFDFPPLPQVGTYIPIIDGASQPDHLLPWGSELTLTPEAQDLEALLNYNDGALPEFATVSDDALSLQLQQQQTDSIFNYSYASLYPFDESLHPPSETFADPQDSSCSSFVPNHVDHFDSYSAVYPHLAVSDFSDTESNYPPLGDFDNGQDDWSNCLDGKDTENGSFDRTMVEQRGQVKQRPSVVVSSEHQSLGSAEHQPEPVSDRNLESLQNRILQRKLKKRSSDKARRERAKLKRPSQEPRTFKKDDPVHQEAMKERARQRARASRARKKAERLGPPVNLITDQAGYSEVSHSVGSSAAHS